MAISITTQGKYWYIREIIKTNTITNNDTGGGYFEFDSDVYGKRKPTLTVGNPKTEDIYSGFKITKIEEEEI